MRVLILIFSTVVLIGLGVYLAAVDRLESSLLEPMGGPSLERVVQVPPDMSVEQALSELVSVGLVADDPWLSIYGSTLRAKTVLQPGEYALSSDMNPLSQIARVEQGDVMTHTVNLEPGGTTADFARVFSSLGLAESKAWLTASRRPQTAARLGVTAPSLEGFLLPDAYTFPKGRTPEQILEVLVKRFDAAVAPLASHPRAPKRPRSEVVMVASLIEASRVPSREHRIYAAYLYNRLDRKMPLDHPATAAYGRLLGLPADDNPYRTDRPGRPPTPICNPGLGALSAAFRPAESQALYMVPNEDGSSRYCPDRECYAAALRANQGLPPTLPPPLPPRTPVVTPDPNKRPPPLVVPGQPLRPQPPSESVGGP